MGGHAIRSETLQKGDGIMVTYNDLFTFIIMLCAVITLISNFKQKKITVRLLAESDGYL